jgi:hypothetical protein
MLLAERFPRTGATLAADFPPARHLRSGQTSGAGIGFKRSMLHAYPVVLAAYRAVPVAYPLSDALLFFCRVTADGHSLVALHALDALVRADRQESDLTTRGRAREIPHRAASALVYGDFAATLQGIYTRLFDLYNGLAITVPLTLVILTTWAPRIAL